MARGWKFWARRKRGGYGGVARSDGVDFTIGEAGAECSGTKGGISGSLAKRNR